GKGTSLSATPCATSAPTVVSTESPTDTPCGTAAPTSAATSRVVHPTFTAVKAPTRPPTAQRQVAPPRAPKPTTAPRPPHPPRPGPPIRRRRLYHQRHSRRARPVRTLKQPAGSSHRVLRRGPALLPGIPDWTVITTACPARVCASSQGRRPRKTRLPDSLMVA